MEFMERPSGIDVLMLAVTFLDTESNAVAPGFTNGLPNSMVMGLGPLSVTTGAVVSMTFTVRVRVTMLFPLSRTV